MQRLNLPAQALGLSLRFAVLVFSVHSSEMRLDLFGLVPEMVCLFTLTSLLGLLSGVPKMFNFLLQLMSLRFPQTTMHLSFQFMGLFTQFLGMTFASLTFGCFYGLFQLPHTMLHWIQRFVMLVLVYVGLEFFPHVRSLLPKLLGLFHTPFLFRTF